METTDASADSMITNVDHVLGTRPSLAQVKDVHGVYVYNMMIIAKNSVKFWTFSCAGFCQRGQHHIGNTIGYCYSTEEIINQYMKYIHDLTPESCYMRLWDHIQIHAPSLHTMILRYVR